MFISYWLAYCVVFCFFFFFSSRRRHTRCSHDWSSDVCSSDLIHSDSYPEGYGGSQSSYPPNLSTENETGDTSFSAPQVSVTISGDEARDKMAKLGRYRDVACGHRLLY